MTPEQAIKILSSETSLEAVEELKYYAGFDKDKVVEQIQEAMDMGADTLKKETPQKAVRVIMGANGSTTDGCPFCGKEFFEMVNYCPDCGQKINWEREKENEQV